MKYAASYTSKIKLKDFDEIIIRYDRQEMQLLPFLEEHSTQNIILSISLYLTYFFLIRINR